MGQVNFTPKQQLIFQEVSKNSFLRNNFYFTGGTALAAVYLNHRLSDDLDFFSEEKFEVLPISNLITEWSSKYNLKVTPEDKEVVKIFNLEFPDGEKLKVDFGYYPYHRLRKGKKVNSFNVDSLFDIGVNKLQTIRQRNEVKDFVDLYFLLKEFTIWDLMEGVRFKFNMEIDPYLIAVDSLKAQRFENMPQMIEYLELEELKSFYADLAKKLGKSAVKE